MTVESQSPESHILQKETPSLLDTPEDSWAKQMRSEWLDALLDPDGRLPKVTFGEDSSLVRPEWAEPGLTGYRVYDARQEPVGSFLLETETGIDGGHTAQLGWVEVNKKKQGYGKAIYTTILKSLPSNTTFASHSVLSSEAEPVWQWLKSRHLATEDIDSEGNKVFRAHVPDFAALKETIQHAGQIALEHTSNPT